MCTCCQEDIAGYGNYQNDQADVNKYTVFAGINHFLCRNFRQQHADDKANIEVRKKRHEIFFLRQNRRVCDDCPIRNHEKCHVEHKGQRGIIDGIFDGEFFSFYFWIFDSAAGYADQSNDGNGQDCQKRCFAVQVVLHLNAYIRAYCHAEIC